MSALDDWTGAGIGEGITRSALYARAEPNFESDKITLWPDGITLLLWHAAGTWFYVSDLACEVFGWSHGGYIRRML